MGITAKPLVQATAVPTTAAAQYTVPASTSTQIKKFTVTNSTAAAILFNVYLLETGQTAIAATLLSSQTVPANKTVEIIEAEGHILAAAGAIWSSAATAGLSLMVSGLEIV